MIAASDPQEYVPSGRQQALEHPGYPEDSPKKTNLESDDFLLSKLEKITLSEAKQNESWLLRKTPTNAIDNTNYYLYEKQCNKNESTDCFDKSSSFKSPTDSCGSHHQQVRDPNVSKYDARRLSFESDFDAKQNVSRNSSEATKSQARSKRCRNDTSLRTKLEPSFMEDELYIKGHTVVWSRGLVTNTDDFDNGRTIVCCYTSCKPIKHALWCTFYCERPTYDQNLTDYKMHQPSGVPVPSVCIIDSATIKVFTQKGESFVIALPFQVENVWKTRFGIFIEKDNSCNNVSETFYEFSSKLYSLTYPLDDICSVALCHQSHLQMLNNNQLKIVFTSETPSICMMYDSITKQHSVYYVRKVKFSENNEVADGHYNNYSAMNTSDKLKSRLSMWENLTGSPSPNLVVPSPIGSKPTSVASFLQQSRSHSSMATISRCQSPGISSMGSWIMQASRLHTSFPYPEKTTNETNKSYFDHSKSMSYLRSRPNVCMEYLWTDNYSLQENTATAGPATKVFLCDDLTRQWYLCYILPSRFQLSIVKIDFSNEANINFGVLTSISAKDAVPVPHLHMLAILEHNGNVTLYSGLNVVGKLHIGGTLAQHTPSPFVRRNIPQFNTPFPRRSSLLPHSNSTDPKFDEHMLSPVWPKSLPRKANLLKMINIPLESDNGKAVLSGLIDAIENRITLKYSDGTYYRITLPSLASSALVESCLNALRQCLQRDAAITLLTRWYATRNVLGSSDITTEQEFLMLTQLIYELLGYEEEQVSEIFREVPVTPSAINSKRQKQDSLGDDDDFNYMINSDYKLVNLSKLLKLDLKQMETVVENNNHTTVSINTKSLLFPYIRLIHFTLHLLYEDLKLNTLRTDDLLPLMKVLNKLANDLGLVEYSIYYWKDFPQYATIQLNAAISEMELKNVNFRNLPTSPVSIMHHIHELIKGESMTAYPYTRLVNERSKNIVQLCGVLGLNTQNDHSVTLESFIDDILNSSNVTETNQPSNKSIIVDKRVVEQVVLLMVEMKITLRDIETLPVGVYFLLYNALWQVRENPPSDWPAEAYFLIWREDLAAQVIKTKRDVETLEDLDIENKNQFDLKLLERPAKQENNDVLDSFDEINSPILKLRFFEDVRVTEVYKMLQSSKPVPISLVQRPDVSDHDFIEEQEKHLYAICTRTMALPVGRGMFSLRTASPVITEPLATPDLCLTGKTSPRGITVELSHIDTPGNMNLWPLFHNGVANGLRVNPAAQNIDDNWILFNKPKTELEQKMEHAGFLMALGLNGHLPKLRTVNTYEYLVKMHEMTSIAVLLGLSAAARGTADTNLTKMLSVHIEALLPPTSMELDVSHNVQVAGLLGVGLLYEGTAHRHITEVLLSEIGRPPGPEMENSVDRESYSLAAGLALGLVTLKRGGQPAGLSDLYVADTLHYYIFGGNKRPLIGSQKDKYKVPSFQIREGSSVNLDVTAPGATLALGLMYLGTGNKAVADWMAPPATQYLLDFVRPDFLMLRTLSRMLILWNDIEASKDWVESQVPASIRPFCMVTPSTNAADDIDYEAMNQAYCNIIAGACFALGLRFAGTADEEACETLLNYCRMFTSLTTKSIAELAGKPTIETCLNVLLISASMVMAGTGNLDIIRFVRHLRKRVGVATSAVVTYGSHLAIHMALGLLFLGGGRYTLSNTPSSVAALICAFYPKFPTHSSDNRYHLQAFRHLYVLAVQSRLILPIDVNLKKCCYANLLLVKLDGSTINVKAPAIIPDLNGLSKVMVDDDRYWQVVFERGRNWNLLLKIVASSGLIEVKQRAGCLSYIVDKFGYHSQLARTLTQSQVVPWDPSPSAILSFTSDKSIHYFCDQFLTPECDNAGSFELRLRHILAKITYEAVVKDKLIVISVFTSLIKILQDLKSVGSQSTLGVWQIKLIISQVICNPFCNLLSKEIVLALKNLVIGIFDSFENEHLWEALRSYMLGNIENVDCGKSAQVIASYIRYYDLPYYCMTHDMSTVNSLEIAYKFDENYSSDTVNQIIKAFNLGRLC